MSCTTPRTELTGIHTEAETTDAVVIVSAAGITGAAAAEAFVSELIASGPAGRFALTLILPTGSTLLELCERHKVHAIPVAANRGAVVAAQKEKLQGRTNAVIHAHSDLDHAAAVACHKETPTVFVIATWYDISVIGNTSTNRDRYVHATAVNMFIDASVRDAMHAKVTGGNLKLPNPMLIHQPHLGPDSRMNMLEHCYLSLLKPCRNHAISGSKRDYSHIRLSYITHFYCNQQNISSVYNLLEKYAGYPADILDRVHFVIVDDGSPITYDIPKLNLNLTWLKISEDIPWNQSGSRNLGVLYAKSDNFIMLDLDHEIPVEAMGHLVKRRSCGKRLYKMYRTRSDSGTRYSGHPNLFFMSRGRFFEMGGYDEEFAGNYGAEDYRFVKYHKACGTLQKYLPKHITCRERTDIDRSRSYHSLSRDLSFNTPVDSRKKMELANYGHGAGHSRMFLNFNWTIPAERWRDTTPEQKPDRLWKLLSIFRQILPRF
jgi:hypothetical protein